MTLPQLYHMYCIIFFLTLTGYIQPWQYGCIDGKYGNINININMAMLTFYMHVAQRKGIGIAALFTIMT